MKICYLILAHKDLNQVNRLIRSLDTVNCSFFVHIDAKIKYSHINKNFYGMFDNVYLIKNRHNIEWGGFNMVKATIALLKAAAHKIKNDDAYFVLLSGQDFPIKSSDNIYRYLHANYGKQFIEYFPLPDNRWIDGGFKRFRYYWFIDSIGFQESEVLQEMQKKMRMVRPYFENFPPHGGSQWFAITSKCANYILKFLKYNEVFTEYFKTTCIADEIFFNTIIANSPFSENIINNNLKYMDWTGQSSHPKIVDITDWPNIKNSNALWVRKVDQTLSASLLALIENHIRVDSRRV